MRIPSGKTDIAIYFVAVDATDLKTRETGLATWTVYRSRDGAAEVAYTTPTITEIDATNMPGVYALLIDEDTTIESTSDSEEYCVHITHSGMAPVTRTIELYRRAVTTGETLTVTSSALGANTITATSIATGAIDADAIADNAIDAGSIAANAITAAKIATDAITADKIAADAIGASELADGAITAATFAAGAIDATAIATGAIDADAIAADAITAAKVAADVGTEFADALLNRDMSTGTDSGSATVRTPRQAFRFLRNKWSISSTTLTVCKEDDTTTSWTSEVTATAGADPITANDPASA